MAFVVVGPRMGHSWVVRYVRWARPQEITRVVEPHGLVLKAGLWYLVAFRDGRQRTYRISRILGLDVLEGIFERQPGFDLARSWKDYLVGFDSRREAGHAVLRLSPDSFGRPGELMEPAVVRAAKNSAAREADGWRRVTVPVDRPGRPWLPYSAWAPKPRSWPLKASGTR